MCADCDATWRRVSIPWSAGEHVTRGTAARLGNVRTIELRHEVLSHRQRRACVNLEHALAPCRVLEHLPALRPGGQRSLELTLAGGVRYFHASCAFHFCSAVCVALTLHAVRHAWWR